MFIAKFVTFKGVVIMTDDDKAGNQAAAELEAGLTRHTQVLRVRLQPGTDATSTPAALLKRTLWHAITDLRATLVKSGRGRKSYAS